MTHIKAFVGHSFLPEDSELVRKFTDFLDQVKKTVQGFDWVHATEPRPDAVQAKVLDLIQGCNIFIGICSKNERAAKDSAFHPGAFWQRDALIVNKGGLVWKTSDWIIQEIGLAIGRDMKLILLLETGVRKPGGLFGDLEYISFSRSNPEASFTSILGMISTIAESKNALHIEVGSGSETAPKPVIKSDADDPFDSEEPDGSWDEEKFEFHHFLAVLRKDADRTSKIYDAFMNAYKTNPSAIAKWTAATELHRVQYGSEGNVSKIYEIAGQHSKDSQVLLIAARASLHYEDTQKAKHYFTEAAKYETDQVRKINTLGSLAEIDENTLNEALMNAIRELSDTPDCEKVALQKLRSLNNLPNNGFLKVAMLERELEIDPSDINKRFEAAYLHHDLGNKELAFYHYLKIPHAERTATTWNNLGVSYRDFSIFGKSIEAYKRAADQGESLAMSNLATIFTDVGLHKEANEYLKMAQKLDSPHPNAATALVHLNETIDAEGKKIDSVLSGQQDLSRFYGEAGHGVLTVQPSEIGRFWSGEGFKLMAEVSGDQIKLIGKLTVAGSEIVNALSGNSSPPEPTIYDVDTVATIIGLAAVGKTKRKKVVANGKGSLFDWFSDETTFVAAIKPDGSAAKCLLNGKVVELRISTSP